MRMSVQRAGSLAERTAPLGDHCPIDRTMQLVGNRTAVLLLREAFYGATRFDDLVRRVGVTEAVASQRLRELYLLTEAGHELLPVLLALAAWGTSHIAGGGPAFSHAGCGGAVEVAVRCGAGHDVQEQEVLVTGRRLARS